MPHAGRGTQAGIRSRCAAADCLGVRGGSGWLCGGSGCGQWEVPTEPAEAGEQAATAVEPQTSEGTGRSTTPQRESDAPGALLEGWEAVNKRAG
jgi:hypothetical protein